jgi:hypothetical protein
VAHRETLTLPIKGGRVAIVASVATPPPPGKIIATAIGGNRSPNKKNNANTIFLHARAKGRSSNGLRVDILGDTILPGRMKS